MKILIVMVVFCLFASTVYAEEPYMVILKRDVTTVKKAVIAKAMKFSDGEADVFWPVYKDYQLEMDKLNDTRRELHQEYKAIQGSMSEEVAEVMALQSFDIAERELQLRRKYFKKFSEVIFTSRVTKFFLIDRQVSLMVELQINSKLRLIR